MIHALKIKEEYFKAVIEGDKTFEVRLNDRDFRVGDKLALNEVDACGNYTGAYSIVDVSYILDKPEYVKEGFVVLGIKQREYSPTRTRVQQKGV